MFLFISLMFNGLLRLLTAKFVYLRIYKLQYSGLVFVSQLQRVRKSSGILKFTI